MSLEVCSGGGQLADSVSSYNIVLRRAAQGLVQGWDCTLIGLFTIWGVVVV